MRILANILIFALEVAGIVAVAVFAFHHPLAFAATSAGLALLLGLVLEHQRLRHELPFYFDRKLPGLSLGTWAVAIAEASVKAILAGLVALLTFSGTDQVRLVWIAILFGATMFAGTSILRRLVLSLGAAPTRWGYFRLAAPLGLLFSLALSILLPPVSLGEVGSYATFQLPSRPSIAQASEFLYLLKSSFDQMIVSLLSQVMNVNGARIVGAVLSTNVFTGFVAASYVVVIAELVRRLEAGAARLLGE